MKFQSIALIVLIQRYTSAEATWTQTVMSGKYLFRRPGDEKGIFIVMMSLNTMTSYFAASKFPSLPESAAGIPVHRQQRSVP